MKKKVKKKIQMNEELKDYLINIIEFELEEFCLETNQQIDINKFSNDAQNVLSKHFNKKLKYVVEEISYIEKKSKLINSEILALRLMFNYYADIILTEDNINTQYIDLKGNYTTAEYDIDKQKCKLYQRILFDIINSDEYIDFDFENEDIMTVHDRKDKILNLNEIAESSE